VENESAVRHVVQAALGRAGYEVIEAANGAEVLRVVESRPGRVTEAGLAFYARRGTAVRMP
jgi:CheY-like chemotaxis protein